MYQILIISKSIVNKSKRSINLFVKYSLLYLKKHFWLQTYKLKPGGWPCKIFVAKFSEENKTSKKTYIEEVVAEDDDVEELI